MDRDEIEKRVLDGIYRWVDDSTRQEGLAGGVKDYIMAEIDRVEPRFPPKGTICEVWDDGGQDRFVKVSFGNGNFTDILNLNPDDWAGVSWDHYRAIPTAEDALKVIKEARKALSNEDSRWTGLNEAVFIVKKLIFEARDV